MCCFAIMRTAFLNKINMQQENPLKKKPIGFMDKSRSRTWCGTYVVTHGVTGEFWLPCA